MSPTWTRRLSRFALALALLAPLAHSPARAQEEAPPAEGDEKGRPVDGYIVFFLFAAGALFVVCKSARR